MKKRMKRLILVDGEEIYHDSQKYWLCAKEKSVLSDFENWVNEFWLPAELDNRSHTTDQICERRSFFKIFWIKFFRKGFKFKS